MVITFVLKEFTDVAKKFQDKPSPIYDTQPEIESDSEEFTYYSDIDSDFDEDIDNDFADDQVDEKLGDDIVQSSTLIFPKVTPVITKLVDVFLNMLHIMTLVTHFRVTCPLLALHYHKKIQEM